MIWRTRSRTLRNRPRQLVGLLDALLSEPTLAASIADEPVTAIGHSLGGYTVLSVAGGEPRTQAHEPIPVVHDARLGALVLMAPACGFFLAPGALGAVTAPILALTAEHDPLTSDHEIRAALAGLPDPTRLTIRTIANAGHFSFLSPFPRPCMLRSSCPPTTPQGSTASGFTSGFPVWF